MSKKKHKTLSPVNSYFREHYSEVFKRKVVSDINQGLYTIQEAMRKYGIGGKTTVYKWVAKYKETKTIVPRGVNMSKKQKNNKSLNAEMNSRIRYLEQAVSDLTIENKILKTTIEVADEVFDLDLKKNFDNSLSEKAMKRKG